MFSTVLRRFGLLLLGQGVGATGQFCAAVIVARRLGPADFGVWSFAVAYTAIFASVVDFGMSFILIRDLARHPERTSRYLGNVLAIKSALSVCALALIAALLPIMRVSVDHWPLILLLGAQTVLSSFAALLAAALYARGSIVYSATLRSLQGLLLAAGAAIAAYASAGLLSFGITYVGVGLLVAAGSLGVMFWRLGVVSPRFEISFWRGYLRGLLPVALAVMLTTVYYSADMVMLGLAGLEQEVGWYNAGYRFVYAILLLVGALTQAFLPDQARSLDAVRVRERETLVRYYRTVWALAVPVVALGPFVAPALMTSVYGREYEGGVTALQILLGAGATMFFSSYFGSLLLLANGERSYLWGVGLGATSNLVLNAFLIPAFTLNGAAVATVASEVLVAIWMCVACARLVPLAPRSVFIPPIVLGASAGAASAALIFAGYPALPIVMAGALLYFVALHIWALLFSRRDAELLVQAETAIRRAA